MKLSPFETYNLYIGLKNHFTTANYDYFKYHGKTRASQEAFEARKDRFYFDKLAQRYSSDEMVDFMVANLVKERSWIGDFLDPDAEELFTAYQKRKQAITHTVLDEVSGLLHENSDPKALFRGTEDNEYPPILLKFIDGSLSLETLVVLNRFCGFMTKFDERYGEDDLLWGKIRFMIHKLKPFIHYDKAKVKNGLDELLFNQS